MRKRFVSSRTNCLFSLWEAGKYKFSHRENLYFPVRQKNLPPLFKDAGKFFVLNRLRNFTSLSSTALLIQLFDLIHPGVSLRDQ